MKSDFIIVNSLWVQSKLRVLWPMRLELLDRAYTVPTMDYFLYVALADLIDQKPYIEDFRDCDDYALWFKAMCSLNYGITSTGLVRDYSSGHAYNSVVFPEGNVMLFEPQTDSLTFITKRNRKMYGLGFGFILV